MLRLFGRNLIISKKSTELFTKAQNVRYIALSPWTSSSSFEERTSDANNYEKRDPEKVKRAKLFDVLIVSSIGIIGFGYLIVRRIFSDPVHAKSAEGLASEVGRPEELEAGSDIAGSQAQRKKRKTFRETKVG